MATVRLAARSLAYYWRTNLAALLGVATAVAALGGALVVGDSVRASLRDIAFARLGATTRAVASPRFFREDVAAEAGLGGGFSVCPLIALRGVATDPDSQRFASDVLVYGVDARFFAFHGRPDPGLGPRDALLSEGLASELGTAAGATLIVRIERPSDVSAATLFGRRDDLGRTLRLKTKAIRTAAELGEFSLQPGQRAQKAVFVLLPPLQKALGREARVNTLLFHEEPASDPGAVSAALRRALVLEDLGLRARALSGPGVVSVESDSALLEDGVADAARTAAASLSWPTSSVLTYLANRLRHEGREVPYSLVAGLDAGPYRELAGAAAASGPADQIVLNDWAAAALAARAGDQIGLDYYVWHEEGALETRTASFTVAAIVPIAGPAADRDLTPAYPGITDSLHLGDWDPPFPVDLKKVGPRDEDYWRDHRTTPKAFIPLARAQELWGHRLGRVSSVRVHPPADLPLDEARGRYEARLLSALDPARFGFAAEPVREQGLAAAAGSTDFGEYFVYFSSFLVASALLLAALFFRLGLEQRQTEVGLLLAVGFRARQVRRHLLGEGLVLAFFGSALGAPLAAGYAGLVLVGLRTIWRGAVSTNRLALHVSTTALVVAAVAGVVTGGLAITMSLRALRHRSARALLAGGDGGAALAEGHGRHARKTAIIAAGLAVILLAGAAAGRIPAAGGFFGAGACLLTAGLALLWQRLTSATVRLSGVIALGVRSAAGRPGRSLLCIALVASATFVIVSVGAFQHGTVDVADPKSGGGGYTLYAESLVAVPYPFDTAAGLDALNLRDVSAAFDGIHVARFRLAPGDDASCMNLYEPRRPRVLGAEAAFLKAGRFHFADALAETPEQKANPWLTLGRRFPDGAVPAIADQNSITYVLHRKLGDDLVLPTAAGPVRLRLVAALAESLFQSELIVAEPVFQRLFPEDGGYRFFLIDAPDERTGTVTSLLESRLADRGFDASSTAERLAGFFAVENTYLSTFQALGGLGLLLGTVGLGTVLLRNVLERRRELALVRAVGFRRRQIRTVVLAENLFLLFSGLGLGAASALVAVAPAAFERGGSLPVGLVSWLLLGVVVVGVAASWIAVALVSRSNLLAGLRAE